MNTETFDNIINEQLQNSINYLLLLKALVNWFCIRCSKS